MTKWLPTVRWGSLELDASSERRACGLAEGSTLATWGVPWVDQSNLTTALGSGARVWVGVSDYYRYPHLQHFESVAGLLRQLHGADLAATRTRMLRSGVELREEALVFYRAVLAQLLEAPGWRQLSERGTCRSGFLA